jgi:N utilization substance protein A
VFEYGFDIGIRVKIDRDTGDINLGSYLKVVDTINAEEEKNQILLKDAKKINSNIAVDEFIIEKLPPFDFGRVAAQNAKGIIIQKIREADKSRQYNVVKDRVGEIVLGIVKRSEFGNFIIDLGKGEGIIKREELIPREAFKNSLTFS